MSVNTQIDLITLYRNKIRSDYVKSHTLLNTACFISLGLFSGAALALITTVAFLISAPLIFSMAAFVSIFSSCVALGALGGIAFSLSKASLYAKTGFYEKHPEENFDIKSCLLSLKNQDSEQKIINHQKENLKDQNSSVIKGIIKSWEEKDLWLKYNSSKTYWQSHYEDNSKDSGNFLNHFHFKLPSNKVFNNSTTTDYGSTFMSYEPNSFSLT